jgi:ABC-type multidrug transport system ATPase subunit
MFGLLGPNGAGKTTLMNTLATLQEPDGGTIRLGEIDVLKDKLAVRQRLGYLPQEFGVYPGVSAEAMLDYLAELKGLADSKARKRHVAELLELVNLNAEKKRTVETFSGGMRQRFGVAQALIGNPEFIIVDEPTAGLDPMERNRFHNLLNEIGEKTIVILSTHIVEDISNLCERMAIMNHGKIIAEGTPGELIENLRGQLWQKRASKDELPGLEQRFNLIAARMSAGRARSS